MTLPIMSQNAPASKIFAFVPYKVLEDIKCYCNEIIQVYFYYILHDTWKQWKIIPFNAILLLPIQCSTIYFKKNLIYTIVIKLQKNTVRCLNGRLLCIKNVFEKLEGTIKVKRILIRHRYKIRKFKHLLS